MAFISIPYDNDGIVTRDFLCTTIFLGLWGYDIIKDLGNNVHVTVTMDRWIIEIDVPK